MLQKALEESSARACDKETALTASEHAASQAFTKLAEAQKALCTAEAKLERHALITQQAIILHDKEGVPLAKTTFVALQAIHTRLLFPKQVDKPWHACCNTYCWGMTC